MEPMVGAKDAPIPHRHQEGHHRRHHQKRLGTPNIKDIIGFRRYGKTTILYQVAEHLTSQRVKAKDIIFLNFYYSSINKKF
ncbi:MAG: AAA family ATPase [Euryarchaeota archaeon]|nr:AAA family ATPase [Euryarchaeota archaeon]